MWSEGSRRALEAKGLKDTGARDAGGMIAERRKFVGPYVLGCARPVSPTPPAPIPEAHMGTQHLLLQKDRVRTLVRNLTIWLRPTSSRARLPERLVLPASPGEFAPASLRRCSPSAPTRVCSYVLEERGPSLPLVGEPAGKHPRSQASLQLHPLHAFSLCQRFLLLSHKIQVEGGAPLRP